MARLLVASPNPKRRAGITSVLQRDSRNSVIDAVDAQEAFAALAGSEFDLVILDVDLPLPGWRAVVSAAREAHPGALRMLVTHQGALEETGIAFEKGDIHKFVFYPFQVEEVEEATRELLDLGETIRRFRDTEAGVEQHLRRFGEAVDRGSLRLVQQPIVRTSDGSLYGVELLLRSVHPELAGPLEVLEAVERCHRILHLGLVVNRLAATWARRVPENVLLFVNLHPAQLGDPQLMETFAPLLPFARRVVLEITERSGLAEVGSWEGSVETLTANGFRVAIDDLGAGYSTLNMLVALEPAIVKVDASLVRDIDRNLRKQGVLSLLVRMAGLVGAELIAEGVETREEFDAAVRCGVELIQGFYVARPQDCWPPVFGEE